MTPEAEAKSNKPKKRKAKETNKKRSGGGKENIVAENGNANVPQHTQKNEKDFINLQLFMLMTNFTFTNKKMCF